MRNSVSKLLGRLLLQLPVTIVLQKNALLQPGSVCCRIMFYRHVLVV